jgi:tRNA(Ile)-lysidine synthase
MKKINKDIYAKVLDYIHDKELLGKGEKILLALSAGKDSMMLLDVFLHIKHELSIDIGIFHLNHMMRADESDDDEKFVTEIAGSNNIKLYSFKFAFRNNKPKGVSFEEFARIKRYEFLERIRSENNFQKIATAHNRDDNIETILMRILSGTGIHGLGGIEPKRGKIIRPLLFLSAKEIYGHLNWKKINWREDSSNKNEKYLRNFVRNSLLPEINSRFEGAGEAILSLSGIAGEYTILIDELLKEHAELYILENNSAIVEKDVYIDNKKLFKYIISKAIRENFNEFVTAGILEEIYKKAVTEKTHMLLYKNKNLSIRKTLRNTKKVIVIAGNTGYNNNKIDWEYKIDLNSNSNKSIILKEINIIINFKLVDYNYFLKNKNSDLIFISLKEDFKKAKIRNRRDGDKINLEYGFKKIKDLMIESKLEKNAKDAVPLLVIDSAVAVYMPGIAGKSQNRVSADFYVKRESKKILAMQSEKYEV